MVKSTQPQTNPATKSSSITKKFKTSKALIKRKIMKKFGRKNTGDVIKCSLCRFVAVDSKMVELHNMEEHLKMDQPVHPQPFTRSQPLVDPPKQQSFGPELAKLQKNFCSDCQKPFTNKRSHKLHINSANHHHQDKTSGTKKIFKLPYYLRSGKAERQNEPIDVMFECFVCNDKFGSKFILNSHIKIVHQVARKVGMSKTMKKNCIRRLF